ncbi:hypothetical protein Bca101_020023 [Brassica carinata]
MWEKKDDGMLPIVVRRRCNVSCFVRKRCNVKHLNRLIGRRVQTYQPQVLDEKNVGYPQILNAIVPAACNMIPERIRVKNPNTVTTQENIDKESGKRTKVHRSHQRMHAIFRVRKRHLRRLGMEHPL